MAYPQRKPTAPEDWTRSDEYHNSFLIAPDSGLTKAKANSQANGLPDIAVSAAQGKFLSLIARSINAKSILEVGTLGGYSTIWFAKALPEDGKVVTLELDEKHADVAQANITNAGLTDKVEIIRGPATISLQALKVAGEFDLAFIDADKPNNTTYYIEAKRLVRKGGVIIVDNVVRHGRVSDPNEVDEACEGVRALLRHIKEDKEVDATTIGMVGEKGYDGMLYSVKL